MSEVNSDNKQPQKPTITHKKFIKHIKKAETATLKHTHKFLIRRWDNVREVQSKVAMWVVVMGLLIAATGLQMMWFQKSYLTISTAKNSTYAEAVLGPVETLNPIFANSSAELSAGYLTFSSLLKYDSSGKLNFDIARSMTVDETGKIYEITIKDDVYWHDGEKLSIDDIAFTIDLIKNPNTRSAITGWVNISVNVIDENTITFTLPSVYAAFEHALTFAILPKHLLKDVEPSELRENEFSQNPIGSGPFKFRFEQSTDDNGTSKIIYLARNERYYRSIANLEKIQLNVYSSLDEIKDALYTSKVNATAELSPIDIKNIDQDKFSVGVSSVQSGVYAIINTKSSVLGDVNLRRALRYATDVSALLAKLPESTKRLWLPFTDGQLFGENLPAAPEFNLAEAKSILESSGWILNQSGVREKDGVELKISVVTVKGNEFEQDLEALAGQWRSAGFVVETEIFDSSDPTQNIAQNVLQPRNYDVLIYRLEIGADPDVYAYWNSTQMIAAGLNFSNYSNIISDDALTSARSRLEKNIRNAKYITFAKQWLSDAPAIGLYQSSMQYVYGKNVKAFDSSSILVSLVDRFAEVSNWAVGESTVYKTP